jgi:hypothetical protein
MLACAFVVCIGMIHRFTYYRERREEVKKEGMKDEREEKNRKEDWGKRENEEEEREKDK